MTILFIALIAITIGYWVWAISFIKRRYEEHNKVIELTSADIEIITEEYEKVNTDWFVVETYEEKLDRVFLNKAPVSAISELFNLEEAQKAITNKVKRLKEFYYTKETQGETAALQHLGYLSDARRMLDVSLKEIK